MKHPFSARCRWAVYVCLFVAGLLIAASVASAPELILRADDVTVKITDTAGVLTIYLKNSVDSVAGYQFWIQLDRPDIIQFTETFDTTGTLSSGWDLVHVHSASGAGFDVQVAGLADDILVVGVPPPIGPQTTEQPLIRLPFKVLSLPTYITDRTALVNISRMPAQLSFSRPNGTTIGASYRVVEDTACWHCDSWLGTACLNWSRVVGPPCDSTSISLDTIPYIDSLKLATVPGSVTNLNCLRTTEDTDINGDGMPMAISDLVDLIRYIVGDTDSIGDPRSADVNGDCVIDWGDAILLDSLFSLPHDPPPEVWPPLPCACDHPVRVCCWQTRGNLNGDIQHMVDLSDLSILVAYLTGGSPSALKCFDEANINGIGIVDLSDLSYLVAYLVGSGVPPAPCP